jgi:hypothetical protein
MERFQSGRITILIAALSLGAFSTVLPNGSISRHFLAPKPVIDDYFGAKISDPFRWMEAGVSDPRLLSFLKTQNDAARRVLGTFAVPRGKLLARIQSFDSAVAATSGHYPTLSRGLNTDGLAGGPTGNRSTISGNRNFLQTPHPATSTRMGGHFSTF